VFFEGLIIVCEVCGVNDEDIEYVWGWRSQQFRCSLAIE
jgi:hypothetical protein